jgi:3-oxoacyl-[acyl-carrier-protein] synthase-3
VTALFGIEHIACFLPTFCDAYHEWAVPAGMDEAFVQNMRRNEVMGFTRALPGQTTLDLTNACLRDLFAERPELRDEIDLLIHVSTMSTSIPLPPYDIIGLVRDQHHLVADGFSLQQQQCVSPLLAMNLVGHVMHASPDVQAVLVFGADAAIDERYRCREGAYMESDGAAAMLLRRGFLERQVLSTQVAVDSTHYDEDAIGDDLETMARYHITSLRICADLVRQALDDHGLAIEDVSAVMPFSGHIRRWRSLCRLLRLPEQRLYMPNVSRVGHVFAFDTMLNLRSCMDEGRLSRGDIALVIATGEGRTFGVTLIQW